MRFDMVASCGLDGEWSIGEMGGGVKLCTANYQAVAVSEEMHPT